MPVSHLYPIQFAKDIQLREPVCGFICHHRLTSCYFHIKTDSTCRTIAINSYKYVPSHWGPNMPSAHTTFASVYEMIINIFLIMVKNVSHQQLINQSITWTTGENTIKYGRIRASKREVSKTCGLSKNSHIEITW